MLTLTPELLRSIMPNSGVRADLFAGPMNLHLASYGIDTCARISAWLGQIAVESGELRYTRELWGPTELQRTYDGRRDLGNVHVGDGFKYRGRGLIQITGRANYQQLTDALQADDLIAHPELLEQPDLATKSACWFWDQHELNDLADAGDFVAITRRINGGLSNYGLRNSFWMRATLALEACE